MAPNTNFEIMIPNAFPPNDFKLFNILDIKVSTGYLYNIISYMNSMKKRSTAELSTKSVFGLLAVVNQSEQEQNDLQAHVV